MTATAEVDSAVEPETPEEPVEAPETPDEDEEGSELDEDVSQPQEFSEAQVAASAEKVVTQAVAKLDNEAARHAKRLGEIMGEEATLLVQCPLCPPHLAGWRFDVPLKAEEKEVLLAIADPTRAKDYRRAGNAETCPACDGLGQVVSGSLVAGRELIPCAQCNGYGYVTAAPALVAVLPGPEPLMVAPTPTEAPEPLPATDPFGRTPDNPNYGRLPQYER